MNAKKIYLKGKSVFTVSLLVVGITILTVYLTDINYNRTITSNLYLSLSIIGFFLILFLAYGLYYGLGVKDDFSKFRNFERGDIIGNVAPNFDIVPIKIENGIGGFVISIIMWIGMTLLIIFLLIVLEAVFWLSFFIILMTLYWLFFRALKLVFSKSKETKNNFGLAGIYSLSYTALYLGWIFAIVYLSQLFR